jgi:NAD(P)-dependent dehydrogenase (short-subunit alcohol dehydrogenase family)
MDLGLKDATVLITGGSKGIGFACARGFIAEGAKVVMVARCSNGLMAAREILGGGYTYAADLTDMHAAQAVVERVESEVGSVDILINSAGNARRSPPENLTPAMWHAAMAAKFFTYINTITPMIKRMAARRTGVIVNIVGTGGKVAAPSHLPGGSANAALMLASVGLANVYGPSGVRVLAINPGLTNTARLTEGIEAEAARLEIPVHEALRRTTANIPIGRLAEPEEIAAIVVFAASRRASYLTGAVIGMDGGSNPVVV